MLKKSSQYKRFSFRSKLLAGFLSLSLIPLILMSILSYRLAFDWIVNNTSAYAELIIDRVQDELNDLFNETLIVANSIAENAIIQQALQGNFNPQDRQYQLNAQAGEELLEIFRYRDDLFGIAVIGENGQSIISTGRVSREEDFRSRYWYRDVLQAAITPRYFSPRRGSFVFDTERAIFSIAIPVEDELSSVRIGVVLIDIDEKILKEILQRRLEDRGYLFIQYGREGFTSDDNRIPDSEYLVNLANKRPIEEELLNDNKEILLKRDLVLDNIRLVSVVSLEELSRDTKQIGVVLILLMTFSFLVSILTAAFLSSSIARPVQEMRKMMMKVEGGDLTARIPHPANDELGDLGRSFNQMIVRINGLIENIHQDQIQLRKAELRTLQEQINPHFLYNTLDSINWLSRQGRQEDIVTMISGLTSLFRIGLSRGKDIIPFSKEIAHIESYLTIQKIRYEKKFIYELDIDPATNNCMTLKLLLQPLVENALYHGIKEKSGKGLISIRARKVKSFILVEIEDNGLGMTEERQQQVLRALHGKEDPGERTLYGLKNVYDRLKIYYREENSLIIHSIPGEGTTITLKIPVEEKSP